MNAPLAEILRYNRWANDQLLGACRSLIDEQMDHRAAFASGSVRELLLHIVGGQQTFVLRTKGRQHEGELNRGSAWPGFERLERIAADTNDELIEIAAGLDADNDVDLPYMGAVYRFPKSFFLLHAVEHGVEHRTEVKLSLASIGVPSPDLDAWPYSFFAGFGKPVGSQEARE